jgi:hypothetical protein
VRVCGVYYILVSVTTVPVIVSGESNCEL